MIDMYVFKHPTEEYLVRLDPKKEYIKQATYFISKTKNIPLKEAFYKVKTFVSSDASCSGNPIIRYNNKDENGDTFIDAEPILDYIQSVQDDRQVLAPSFTTYVHPSVKKSLHSEFISTNINARKQDKKQMFYYTQIGDKEKADYYDNMQATRKIFNNSLSGAYASKSTILYNPSAHYTLTSITRCLASIGNAVTESIVSGNKIFIDPESVINYLTCILANTDFKAFQDVMVKYNIYYPTVDDVMSMINRSTEWFWNIPSKTEYIRKYVSTFTPLELAAVLYTNDLYHFRKHNPEFTQTFLEALSYSKTGYSSPETQVKDIYNTQEGVISHVHNICADAIRGKAIEYEKMVGTEDLDMLASTAKYVAETLTEYKDFISALLVTNTAPVNIAYIKELMRRCIVLSDTDSTCATYDEWVDWYYKRNDTKITNPIAIASSVMTIATQMLAGNMNIDSSRVESLKMKNEFFWNNFVTMNASKHYFADVSIKEGNVYANPKLELKGVHLIASNVSPRYRDIGHGIINDIRKTLREGKLLNLHGYIQQVADVERDIIQRIKNADTSVLSIDKIKDLKAYKDGVEHPELTPYVHHMLWKEVFQRKYGDPGEPTYMIVKVPSVLDSASKMKNYLDGLEDRELAERFSKFLVRNNKKNIGTFRVPLSLLGKDGLPDEINRCVDYKRIVKDNCNMMYTVLEAIGFYKTSDMLISELGPY